ncbi:vitamin K epoxide reductase family protein [Nocardioides sp.]|uniref:vitamin K epoxide reductase family protein n=1 Tax=Nocardioides sp. TaxID=35761 RepID=UPI00351397AB
MSTDVDPRAAGAGEDLDLEELAGDLPAEDVPSRLTGVLFAVLGTIGLAAAFTLAVDKYKILENPSYRPSCDLNPVLACGSVMVTDQASVFGFPNPLIGVLAFGVVITLGVLVAAGVRLPTWVLAGQTLGAAGGVVFVHWLAFQSLYDINALCPWCMVVWSVTLPFAVWSGATLWRRVAPTSRAAALVWDLRFLIVLAWYLVFAVAILERFWDYWSTLL